MQREARQGPKTKLEPQFYLQGEEDNDKRETYLVVGLVTNPDLKQQLQRLLRLDECKVWLPISHAKIKQQLRDAQKWFKLLGDKLN